MGGISARARGGAIALASALCLFAELMAIRWHADSFQVFAYFRNLSLFACFLGLGIGFARAGSPGALRTPVALVSLGLQGIALRLLGKTPLGGEALNNPVPEQALFGLFSTNLWAKYAICYGFLLLVFLWTAVSFVPLGRLAGRLMSSGPRLSAYGWNLAGSLAGVVAFSACLALWLPPPAWIGIAVLLALPLLGRSPLAWGPPACAAALAAALWAFPGPEGFEEIHSPYQYLTCRRHPGGTATIGVNHAYFQQVLDLRPGTVGRFPGSRLESHARYYDFPYEGGEPPGRVLVLGAGAGNDVAAALRAGAREVDAVEIDPAIADLGRRVHPERPYDDPRVRVILDDARSFLRRTDRSYDLIVYGLLDTHAVLSSHSSVRLDSYVYTVEGIAEAARRLAPGGRISMTFSLVSDLHGAKLARMFREALRSPACAYRTHYDNGVTFLWPAVRTPPPRGGVEGFEEVTARFEARAPLSDPATDDWPFFYMPVRAYPRSYLGLVAIVLACAVALLRGGGRGGGSWPCFFLGAGFMLVETKGITELGLTFGNRWTVVGAMIAGVLVMAMLANAHVARHGARRLAPWYTLLLGSLGAGLLLPPGAWERLPPALAPWLHAAWLALPVGFSGVVFSATFARSGSTSGALASNLLGAMAGGLLEYNVMYFGLRVLYLFALGCYAAAAVASRRR
ncbi:MAG: hypothetical protein HY608_09075, partial [Planctomycetes bacterium]|nr:hypothetical protein [Planctomycetota bacterium]